MLKVLLYGILAWFFYNFIFRFVIPVYRTSKQVKQKFREMQEQMNQHAGQQGPQPQPQSASNNQSSPKKGDYIDFEEVK